MVWSETLMNALWERVFAPFRFLVVRVTGYTPGCSYWMVGEVSLDDSGYPPGKDHSLTRGFPLESSVKLMVSGEHPNCTSAEKVVSGLISEALQAGEWKSSFLRGLFSRTVHIRLIWSTVNAFMHSSFV